MMTALRRRAGHRPLVSLLLAAMAASLAALAPAASAAQPGVLERADAPGYKAAAAPASQARRALAAGLPRRSAAALRAAPARSAAFRRKGSTLRSHAVVLGSPKRAVQTLAGWRAAQRRSGARVERVAALTGRTPGLLARRATRRGSRLAVAWRDGRAIGLIELEASSRDAGLRAAVTGHARLAAVRLRAALRRTPYDALLEAVGRRGPSPRQALQAFAMAVAPLPGVKARPLPRASLMSGTLALRWVGRVRSRLTAAQRGAVDRATARLFGRPSGRTARAAAWQASPGGQAAAEKMRDVIAARLGVPLTYRLRVGADVDSSRTSNAYADPDPETKTCTITVLPGGVDLMKQGALDFLLAHEVFHCFEIELLGHDLRAYNDLPDWRGEGLAEWAGFEASGIDFDPTGNVLDYAETPERPLFARSYDASGFFGRTFEKGRDHWKSMAAILRASDEQAAVLAGAGEDAFLRSWGSSMVRRAKLGPDWTFAEPAPIPEDLRPETRTVYNAATVGVGPYATALYDVHALDRPILRFDIAGRARLTDGSLDTAGLEDAWFCVQQRCECPQGTTGTPPPTQQLAKTAQLALTGTLEGQGTGGTISSHTLREWCESKPEPPANPAPPSDVTPAGCGPGGGGCGTTNGDPHMTTFDRRRYDFQAAGEFVLARGPGGFEVQARQEPLGATRTVTVNTAVAMRVGGARVEVRGGTPLGLLVDGADRSLVPGRPLALPGGGTVAETRGRLTVTWPDGASVRLWSVGRWGVALTVVPAPAYAGQMSGLLGNLDGNPDNDFLTRDGQILPAAIGAAATADTFAQLYGRFGEGWRLRDGESLFRYERGASTATYTDRKVPVRRHRPDEVAGAARAAAERACRAAGIADPGVLEDCILDVGLSSDEAFAVAGAVQERTERPVAAPGGGGPGPGPAPAPPADPDTPVAWTAIDAFANRILPVGLGATPDGVLHAAATTREGGADRITHVPIRADGAIGSGETVAAGLSGRPDVLADPTGYLRLVVAGARPGALGTFTYVKPAAAGAWTAGSTVTTQGTFYLSGRPRAAFGPGGALFTVSPGNERAAVFRNFPNSLGAGLRTDDDCFASRPSIASDGTELWAAWTQWDCDQEGQWVRPVDPATGAVGAATRAPDSTAPRLGKERALVTDPHAALVARPGQRGLFLAYAQPGADGAPTRIRVWRIGADAAFEVGTAADTVASVFLVAEPSGRMWVAWEAADRLFARRLTADGTAAEPGVVRPALPPGASSGIDWAVAARDGRLELVAGRPGTASAPAGQTFHGSVGG